MKFQDDNNTVVNGSEDDMKTEINNRGKRFFSFYQTAHHLDKVDKPVGSERASKFYRNVLSKFCLTK